MNNTQPPITLEEIKYFRDELNDLFPDDPTKKVNVYSPEVKQFYEIINSKRIGIPKGTNPKEIGIILERWYEWYSNTTPAPEYVSNTTLTGEKLKEKIEYAEQRDSAIKKTRENQTKLVEDFIVKTQEQIAKAQAVQEQLKDKVIYAKVEIDPKDVVKLEQLENVEQEKIKHYESLIKQEKFETAKQELASEIEAKVEKELAKEGVLKDEIKAIARETASEAIETLSHRNDSNYVPSSYQTAIVATVATDTAVVPKVIIEKTTSELVKNSAKNVFIFKLQPEILNRETLTIAYGQQFSTFVLGVDPSKIKVTLTETLPQNLTQVQYVEYKEVHLSEVNNHQIDIYQGQINTLNNITDAGKEISGNYIQSNITSFISKKIEALPATSAIKKFASTPEMQAVLFAKFGVGSPVTWQYANPVLMRVMGQNQLAGAFFSTVSKATGEQIVTSITGKAASEVAVGAAVKTGAAAGFGAFLAKGAAAIGVSLGVFTAGVSTAITLAVTAIGKMINWPKVKQWFRDNKEVFAVGTGGLGLMLGGPVAGAVGLGLGLVAVGSLGAFAAGAFNVFGFIGRSVGIAIATPVIITLLVIPPLVAFIMLVINNSAYVVPPKIPDSAFVGGMYTPHCTDEKGQVGVAANLSSSPVANRAWEITADLYQGFWCYWNRSPKGPPADFPKDTIEYPPSYPNLFDYSLFRTNPNPAASSGPNLFWCTWLPVKAYNEKGGGLATNLYSPDMYNDFKGRGKIIDAAKATSSNILPGSVVFFHVLSGENRINHVGVVYTVDQGGIVFVQSNGPLKMQTINFKPGGGAGDIAGIDTIGFGLPN